jgi:hypothetical protein
VIDPSIQQAMIHVADTELMTDDDKFELLVDYVSESANMKEAILEDIAMKDLNGTARVEHFVARMEAATSTAVLSKAVWTGIARKGLLEQPEAYASRFEKAAADCGRTKADINQKFMETLLFPWKTEALLADMLPVMEGKHCIEVQDETELHMLSMAESAFQFEKWAAQKNVSQMEKDGGLVMKQSAPKKDKVKKEKAELQPGSHEEQATMLGLPSRQFAGGRTYHACVACHVPNGKVAYHAPANCPTKKGDEGKKGKGAGGPSEGRERGGTAFMGGAPPRKAGGRQQHTNQEELLCWNCDLPGHPWFRCEQPLRPHLAAKKAAWVSNNRGKDPAVAMTAGASMHTDAAVQFMSLMKEMMKVSSNNAEQKPSGVMLAASDSLSKWAAENHCGQWEEGGFALDDEYSSDNSGMGLLSAQHKCGGQSSVYVSTRAGGHWAAPNGPAVMPLHPPTPKPPSASAKR